jgi:CubicO group peptidase (beta-lactamase class C family)
VLTVVFGQDLSAVLSTRVLGPIGAPGSQLTWRPNEYRSQQIQGVDSREIGSGISASANVMARVGYLHLRDGVWNGVQVLPPGWASLVGQHDPALDSLPNMDPVRLPGATAHYGLLWWTNSDAAMPNVPTDAYFGWGLHDSILLVIPSLDLVAVRAGEEGWQSTFTSDYTVVEPFIEPIAMSVVGPTGVEEGDVRAMSWGRLHGSWRE